MPEKSPYKVVKTLYENASTQIQREQSANDSKSVILKTFKPSQKAAQGFFNEHKTLSTLHLEHSLNISIAALIPAKDSNA